MSKYFNNMITDTYPNDEAQEDIADFDEWTKQIFSAGPVRERIRMWIVEAFWKGQIEDTEILRVFRLHQRGIQLIPELSGKDVLLPHPTDDTTRSH